MRMTEVGADSGYAGVEPVANLYRRNLRIFANLTRIIEPGDRVVVIYGAGHALEVAGPLRGEDPPAGAVGRIGVVLDAAARDVASDRSRASLPRRRGPLLGAGQSREP